MGGVALGVLDMDEALAMGEADVVGGDVVLDVDEGLAALDLVKRMRRTGVCGGVACLNADLNDVRHGARHTEKGLACLALNIGEADDQSVDTAGQRYEALFPNM
jgi:hypothetical protein